MKNPIPATRTLQEIHADIKSLPFPEKAQVYSYVMMVGIVLGIMITLVLGLF